MSEAEQTYLITGCYHGSIVTANSEGEARKLFHTMYNGETIVTIMTYRFKRGCLCGVFLHGNSILADLFNEGYHYGTH